MRIGVLCSGGDSPGMNAAIRGVVLRGVEVLGHEMIGFMDGWRGFLEGDWINLDRNAVRGIAPHGGVMLGTSRVSPFTSRAGEPGDYEMIRGRMAEYGVEGFVLIGGDGTHRVSKMLHDQGIRVVGLPKTIDNDIVGTDYSFGFDTAVSTATEAIDRLRTTGESHRRCMVLEVMGRNAGWIALHAGMAGGAQVTLIPEHPESLDQIAEWVLSVQKRGRSSLVVVAEGFRLDEMTKAVTIPGADRFGRPRLGGIAEVLAPLIEERTNIETRATVLGYVQRGGSPTAFDRVLATRTGFAGADAIDTAQWDMLAALRGDEIVLVPFSEVVGHFKAVPARRYLEVRKNFG